MPLTGVAGFDRNQWQLSIGISGKLRLESVAGFDRNQWQVSIGIRRGVKSPVLTPFFAEEIYPFLEVFLDGISPRKYPTTFFLEGTAVEALAAYCERGIPGSLTQPSCLVWTIIRGHVSSTGA